MNARIVPPGGFGRCCRFLHAQVEGPRMFHKVVIRPRPCSSDCGIFSARLCCSRAVSGHCLHTRLSGKATNVRRACGTNPRSLKEGLFWQESSCSCASNHVENQWFGCNESSDVAAGHCQRTFLSPILDWPALSAACPVLSSVNPGKSRSSDFPTSKVFGGFFIMKNEWCDAH